MTHYSLEKHSQWELSSLLNDKYNRFYFLIYSLDRMKSMWKTGKGKYEGIIIIEKNKSKGNASRWEINTTWKFSRRSSCIRLCAREVPAWVRRRARAPNARHLSPQRETDPRAPAPRFLLARGLRASLQVCIWRVPEIKRKGEKNIRIFTSLVATKRGKN